MKVYLAGDLTDWRNILIEAFPEIEFTDPTTIEEQNALGRFIPYELDAIKKSDIVFAYIKKEGESPSDYFGSTAEMMYAFTENIPVIMVNERTNLHPFHLFVSKYVRTTLVAGMKILDTLVKTNNQFMADYAK